MEKRLRDIFNTMSKEELEDLFIESVSQTSQQHIIIRYEYKMRKELQPDRSARDIILDLSVEFDPIRKTNSHHSGYSVEAIKYIVKK